MPYRHEELYRDELTGVLNRRYLREVLPGVFEEMRSLGLPLSMLVIDLDNFKAINDTYGHLEGDEVLKAFVQFLRESLRQSDLIIRYGGDEFIAVLPHTDQDTAWKVANRILSRMQRQDFHGHALTASIGVATFPTDGWSLHDLFARADQALYRAKNMGRARVESAHVRTPTLEWPVPFVHRTEEERALARAFQNRRGFIVVSGPAGIGKTRLLTEFLSSRGVAFLRGNAYALFQGMAYAPFVEIIQTALQQSPDRLADLAPPYRKAIERLLERSEDLEASRTRLFEAVFRFLETTGAEVFMLDDIQWLDPSSQQLLYFLLRSGLRFVATLRLEENQRITQTFLHSLHREGWVEEIPIPPLSREQVRVLLHRALHMAPDDRIVETLYRFSGGNPYLIGEVLTDLYRKGYLVFRHVWELRLPPTYTPPRSVDTLITYKLGLLSPDHQRLAEAAAILGPRFTIEGLAEVSGTPEDQVMLLLEDLIRIRLVREIPEGFAFPEDVVREAILAKMSRLRRRALHSRAAAYATRTGAPPEVLAYHHHHAGHREEAFRALMEAIEQAQRVYAYPNALQMVELALEDATTDFQRWQAELKQAQILRFLGEYEQATAVLKRLLQRSPEELQDLFGKVVQEWLQLLVARGSHEEAVEEGQRYLNHLKSPEDRIAVELERAWALIHLGRHGQARRILRSIETLVDDPQSTAMAKILNLEALIEEERERWKKAETLYHRALEIYRARQDRRGEGVILTNLAGLYLDRDRPEKAQEYYQKALQVYEAIGYLEGKMITLGDLGVVYNTLGYVDSAIQALQEAVLLAVRMNYQRVLPGFYAQLGWAYAYKAEQERSLGFVELAIESAQAQNMSRQVFFRTLEKGYLLFLFGMKAEAWDVVRELDALMDPGSVRQRFWYALTFLEMHMEEGATDPLRPLMEMLQESLQKIRSRATRFYGWLVLARAWALLQDAERAQAYLDKARRRVQRLHNPLMRGEFYLDQGKTLEVLGDLRKALRSYRQAQKIFQNLGVELFRQDAARREEALRARLR